MADLLTYNVVATAAVDSDVVGRELVVSVNGDVKPTVYFAGNTTELGSVTVPQNAEVVLTLTDVDDAGNRSEPTSLIFVALDTLPPSAPGSIGVTLVGETAAPVEPAVVPETDVSTPEAEG